MPVTCCKYRQRFGRENTYPFIEHRNDSIGVVHGQSASGEKIVLDIDDDKRIVSCDFNIFGRVHLSLK